MAWRPLALGQDSNQWTISFVLDQRCGAEVARAVFSRRRGPSAILRYFSNANAINLSGKAQYQTQLPRLELGGVSGFAGVVLRECVASNLPWRRCIPGRGTRCCGECRRTTLTVIAWVDFVWGDGGWVTSPSSPCGLRRAPRFALRPLVAAPRVARRAKRGGARRDRTADLLHAMQALSQLSYGPVTLA